MKWAWVLVLTVRGSQRQNSDNVRNLRWPSRRLAAVTCHSSRRNGQKCNIAGHAIKLALLWIHTLLKLPLFDKSASFPLSVYTHKPHDILISVAATSAADGWGMLMMFKRCASMSLRFAWASSRSLPTSDLMLCPGLKRSEDKDWPLLVLPFHYTSHHNILRLLTTIATS